MRALKKVNDTLKEAGISKTGQLFDKDEYEAIQDAEYLESKKRKKIKIIFLSFLFLNLILQNYIVTLHNHFNF